MIPRMFAVAPVPLSPASRIALTARDEGPCSPMELAEQVGMSLSMLNNHLPGLEEHEILQASRTPAGEPLLSFHGADRLVAAVHVGSCTTRVAISDLTGTLLHYSNSPAPESTDLTERVRHTATTVKRSLSDAGHSSRDVWCVVFTVPGAVDGEGRVVPSALVPNWAGVDIAARLSDLLGCPVRLVEDGALSSIGESACGLGRLTHNFLNVCLGRRLRVRPVVDGRPFHGLRGHCGSVEYLYGDHFDANGQVSWQTAANGNELVRQAQAGDAASLDEVHEMLAGLGRGIAISSQHFNPEVVVIGGGVGSQLAAWGADLEQQVKEWAHPNDPPVQLRFSQLGADSGLAGGTILALEEVTSSLLGQPAPAPRLTGWPQPDLDALPE